MGDPKSVRGIVCAVALLLTIIGNGILWVKFVNDSAGLYALILIVIASMNLAAFVLDVPALAVVAAGFMYATMSTNNCNADHWKDADDGARLAGYILALLGAWLSFICFPVELKRPTMSPPNIVSLILLGTTALGSVFLWSNSNDGCNVQWFVAMFVATLYTFSKLFDFDRGVQLGFFLATITIDNYQPFGPPCTGVCLAGVVICCLSLLGFVILQIVVEVAGTLRVEKSTFQSMEGIVLVVAVVSAFVGAIFVWASNHVSGREGFVVTLLLAATVLNLFTTLCAPFGTVLSLGALGFLSVISEAISYTYGHHSSNGDEVTRIGYVLLFVGTFASFVSLPVVLTAPQMNEKTRAPLVICLLLCSAAVIGWHGLEVPAIVGFVYAAGLLFGWPAGVTRYAYFFSIVLLPILTPLGQGAITATALAFVAILIIFILQFFEELSGQAEAQPEGGAKGGYENVPEV